VVQSGSVAKVALSRGLESRAAHAKSGLGGMRIDYAFFPLRFLLSLPVAYRLVRMGDRKLTLITDAEFDCAALAENLKALLP